MPLGTLGAHGARNRYWEAILVTATSTLRVIQQAQVPLDRDIFLRSLSSANWPERWKTS